MADFRLPNLQNERLGLGRILSVLSYRERLCYAALCSLKSSTIRSGLWHEPPRVANAVQSHAVPQTLARVRTFRNIRRCRGLDRRATSCWSSNGSIRRPPFISTKKPAAPRGSGRRAGPGQYRVLRRSGGGGSPSAQGGGGQRVRSCAPRRSGRPCPAGRVRRSGGRRGRRGA